jgi:hypothetical protein
LVSIFSTYGNFSEKKNEMWKVNGHRGEGTQHGHFGPVELKTYLNSPCEYESESNVEVPYFNDKPLSAK